MPRIDTIGNNLKLDALFLGPSATQLSGIRKVTVSVNPASINAGAVGTTAVTVAGVATGDMVHMEPPAALETGLVPISAIVTNANEVTITLFNQTAAQIDGAARNWNLLVIELN